MKEKLISPFIWPRSPRLRGYTHPSYCIMGQRAPHGDRPYSEETASRGQALFCSTDPILGCLMHSVSTSINGSQPKNHTPHTRLHPHTRLLLLQEQLVLILFWRDTNIHPTAAVPCKPGLFSSLRFKKVRRQPGTERYTPAGVSSKQTMKPRGDLRGADSELESLAEVRGPPEILS